MNGGERGLGGEGLTQFPLLARLWLQEPDAETVSLAQEQFGLPLADPPELAHAFTDLFLLNVPPYGSVFVDSTGELNGTSSGEVGRAFAASGFEPPELLEVAAPDHLGLCLAHLDLRRHEPSAGYDWSWIPVCCLAVLREPRVHPFYAGLAAETLDWFGALTPQPSLYSGKGEGEMPHPPPPSPHPSQLLQPPTQFASLTDLPPTASLGERSGDGEPAATTRDSLLEAIRDGREDDEVGLGRIVRFLLVPARSGLYLSRGRLGAIAVELGLRLPFGSRFDVARSLFVVAGESELAPRLFDRLQAEVAWWEESYERVERVQPGWAPHAQGWKYRLAATKELLEAMREIASG